MDEALHLTSSEIFAKHQDSMMSSLAHRLEVAKAENNVQLLELLEEEKRQLAHLYPEPAQPFRSLLDSLKSLWQNFRLAFLSDSSLKVFEYLEGNDHWWYAFDPQTGQCVYADSQAELLLWIKENYQGQ